MKLAAAALACVAAACDARAQGGAGSAAASAPAANLPVPVVIPSDWRPLEAPAEAARAAAGRALTVRSWGETGLGCFVTVVEVTGARAEPLAKVAAELQTTLAGLLSVEGWTFVDGAVGEVTATISQPPLRGALRGRLQASAAGVPHAAVAACFYNEREPVRCQTACTALLAGLEAPRVTP